MMERAALSGSPEGWHIGSRRNNVRKITHLLFVDNTLIFCKSTENQVTYLLWILLWFETMSKLKVNRQKSELIPAGEVRNGDWLVNLMGCKKGNLSATYLGIPLRANLKNKSVWDGVKERFRRKLAMWKRYYLSEGGRFTLIKSTLSNLPIYVMSILRIPVLVAARIEKMLRNFLWGSNTTQKKIHLLAWKMCCPGKKEGGLGIKNMVRFNKALLAKRNWKLAIAGRDGCKVVISGKYGMIEEEWTSRVGNDCHGGDLWKTIK